jgi:hypothetical protein
MSNAPRNRIGARTQITEHDFSIQPFGCGQGGYWAHRAGRAAERQVAAPEPKRPGTGLGCRVFYCRRILGRCGRSRRNRCGWRRLVCGSRARLVINNHVGSFAAPAGKSVRKSERDASDMHLTRDQFLRKRAGQLSSAQWNSMSWNQRRDYFQKGFSGPNRMQGNGPQNLNSHWDDVHADTGAANNWHDIPVPAERPTVVGSQNTATPSMLTRDAAVDAIKMALRKPQKLWGNASDLDENQDRTEDLDEDDEDLDEDEDEAKNPNRADAFE